MTSGMEAWSFDPSSTAQVSAEEVELLGAQLTELLEKPDWDPVDRQAVARYVEWIGMARAAQLPPVSTTDWFVWLYLAGRGSGKTRAAAETVAAWSMMHPGLRVAIISQTFKDCRETAFQGESGLLACLPPDAIRRYNRQELILELKNGTYLRGFSSETPESMRGPNYHLVWGDESCAWKGGGGATWDMIRMTLRLAKLPNGQPWKPRIIMTTTPKPTPLIRDLVGKPSTVVSRENTYANRQNLSEVFYREVVEPLEGTELGRQEIHAEILDLSSVTPWKEDWWRVWDRREIPHPESILLSYDTAFRQGKKNDTSAATIWGIFERTDRYREKDNETGNWFSVWKRRRGLLMLDAWKQKLVFPDLKAQIISDYKWALKVMKGDRSKVTVLVEDKGSGQSLVDEFRVADIPVIGWNPGHDSKLLRAHTTAQVLREGFLWVPGQRLDRHGNRGKDPAMFARPVIKECGGYIGTASQSDDWLDSCTQAAAYARHTGWTKLVDDEHYTEAGDEWGDDDDAAQEPVGSVYG